MFIGQFTFELEEVEMADGVQDGVGVELKVEVGGDSRLKLELFDEPSVDLSHAPDQRTRHLTTHTHTRTRTILLVLAPPSWPPLDHGHWVSEAGGSSHRKML